MGSSRTIQISHLALLAVAAAAVGGGLWLSQYVEREIDRLARLAQEEAPVGKALADYGSHATLLGSAFAAGAVLLIVTGFAVARWPHRAQEIRIQGLVEYARRLANGEPPPLLESRADDLLGKLESHMAGIAQSVAHRDATFRNEAARQKLDTEIQRAIGMAETEPDVLEVAGRALAIVVPESPAELLLTDVEQSHLHVATISSSGLSPGCPVESPTGCAAVRRAQTQRFHRSDALDACPRLRDRPDGDCSAVCVPLSVMGQAIGVLHTTAPQDSPLNDHSVVALELIASHVGARLGMLHALEKFQHQAATDPLTGLANRRALQDRVSRALRTRPKAAAVAVCDLDHFKRLNDEHGHEAGDKALQLFSSTLRAALRPVDLVARVGGEEFVVFLPNCDGDGASIALERVRTALAGAVRASGGPIFTVSIGVAVFPSEGADLEQLVKAADRALYMSKNAGRDRITVLGRPGSASLRAAPGPIAPPVLIKIENG